MPIFEEIRDAVSNENFKNGASWPTQRLQHSTIDQDRIRVQMADNSTERQNEQNRSYHILNTRLMKDVVEPDIESANAYKEIATGMSPTSQGYHWANQNQQINGAVTTSIHQLETTVASMQAMMYQIFGLVKDSGTAAK
jgi:hypothetical protein